MPTSQAQTKVQEQGGPRTPTVAVSQREVVDLEDLRITCMTLNEQRWDAYQSSQDQSPGPGQS